MSLRFRIETNNRDIGVERNNRVILKLLITTKQKKMIDFKKPTSVI